MWRWGAFVIGMGSETGCRCGVLGMGAEGAGDAGDADQRSRSDVDPQDLWLCEEDEEPIR